MVSRYVRKAVTLAVGLLLFIGLTAGIHSAGFAQSTSGLEVDVVAARANGNSNKTRLDVYTRVPYSSLRFISTADGFRAHYGVTVEVHELDGNERPGDLIQTRIWDETVQAEDFTQTQTGQLFDRSLQSLELEPGEYFIEFQIEDEASNETVSREMAVSVRDLRKPTSISDLIMIDAYDPAANSITPTVSNRVGSEQESFKLFYEVYSDRRQRIQVTREILRVRKSSGLPSVKSLIGLGKDEDLANAEVSYQETSPRQIRAGRNQYVVEIPLKDFGVGEYIARVSVLDEEGRVLDRAEKSITLQWTGLAEHVRDLDDAIAQLSYIAKGHDIEYIEDGRTQSERLARFRDFWKRRDPTPNTDRNERMEEYYYRIAYANRQYGNLGNGWRTDRGHVMVLFGEPDHVERHPFNFSVKPYEVWYYYRIGRRFIFIDETGLGDYELLVPYWDERTRIR